MGLGVIFFVDFVQDQKAGVIEFWFWLSETYD